MRTSVVSPGSPPAPPLDRDNLQQAAEAARGSAVFVSPDARDVDKLARIAETKITAATTPDGADRWRDLGYWLLPVLVLLLLPWFRQGWAVRYE